MTILDFSSGLPTTGSIKAKGHDGVMLYCSPARAQWMTAKQPPQTYISALKGAGLKFGFVWQYRGGDNTFEGSDVARGYQGGVEDAKKTQAYLDSVECSTHPVFFAVDFNATLPQWNDTIVNYFKGAISVLGKQRVGIYGHSRVVSWAQEDSVVADIGNGRVLGWVTSSWSNGETGHEYAVLYQKAHNITGPEGIQCDVSDIYDSEWGWRALQESVKEEAALPVNYISLKPNPNHRGDPHFLPDVLKAFGVPVETIPGWDNWGMGDFNRIWGVAVHHTGSNNTTAEQIARNPWLENALSSQIHLSRRAPYTATLCGVGIAWHLGKGSYPGLPTNNANPLVIGIEAQSNGTDPWPAAMLDIYHRCVAAILWYLGHNASRCISHWEYSMVAQGKWDPGAGDGFSGHVMDMDIFRSHVQYYIDNPPFSYEGDDMANSLDEVFKSRYPGSNYEATLRDFILNADAHAFASRVNTEKLLSIEEERLQMEKAILESNKVLAESINQLVSILKKG